MRVLVVGGGPGGLFFALLAKRARPDIEVQVVEQNPDGATYGWGVVFTDRALQALRPAAPAAIDEIASRKPPVQHLDVIVRNKRRTINGNVFFRIGRVELLALLQRHARDAGVAITFERRITSLEELHGWDLVVGADGVNSIVRELSDCFAPEVSLGRNWWAWYGTPQPFPAVSLIFEPRPVGLFVGHAYQYAPELSGFVVEAVPEAFEASGLGSLPDDESRAYCETIFARHLEGAALLDNRSLWFRPKFVTCGNWVSGNATLLGDALHTVHPSIGSGTRFAMRDAVALADALATETSGADAVLRRYEAIRRPRADAFQAAARRSIAWYEALAERDLGDPTRFALEYVMRTGRVRYEEFRRLNPRLVGEYERPLRASGLQPLAEVAR